MFVNYAHRGASAYAPENTMAAFRLGVALGANGIETDIRRTKDRVPVLFHDETLARLTGINKKISDFTLDQLAGIPIPSPDGAAQDRIPKLTELLAFASETAVLLALELKDDDLEADLLEAIRAFGLQERSIVTSFRTDHISKIKALDPAQRVGLLTSTVNRDLICALKHICAEQICPKAAILSPGLVRSLHAEGLSVRAWGVRDEETMRFAFQCGVDGMTVNFPDKLRDYAAEAARSES